MSESKKERKRTREMKEKGKVLIVEDEATSEKLAAPVSGAL